MALPAIGLDDIKRLKNATDTTVNDVVLAVCTGALRRFLIEGGELPDKPLVAVVPVSVHPEVDAPGSNKVSSMFVQLPAHLDDPLERLQAIREGTKGAKEEHNALGADMLVNWAEHATPNTFAAAARLYSRDAAGRPSPTHRQPDRVQRARTRLPPVPGRCGDGRRVPPRPRDGRDRASTSPIMSYRGVLYWGIISCPETMPRVWHLAADIPMALDELLDAAGLPRPNIRSRQASDAVRGGGARPRGPEVRAAGHSRTAPHRPTRRPSWTSPPDTPGPGVPNVRRAGS